MTRTITLVSRAGIVVRGRSVAECRRSAERALAETRLARAATFCSRSGAVSLTVHARGYRYAV